MSLFLLNMTKPYFFNFHGLMVYVEKPQEKERLNLYSKIRKNYKTFMVKSGPGTLNTTHARIDARIN